MLGGLVTATLLSLLVAPALYARFGGDYDAADDLLRDLGDDPGAPAAADGKESWITVNPDVIESTPKQGKRGQPRRRTVVDGASDVPSEPGDGAS
jgi:hypothetical protein